MATRYVYKKAKATFTNSFTSLIYDYDLNLGYPSEEEPDGSWPYGYVYVLNNFTTYAKTYSFRYNTEQYLAKYGEEIIYKLNSYTRLNSTSVETGYDEETGETQYEDQYTIPAGSYFIMGDYFPGTYTPTRSYLTTSKLCNGYVGGFPNSEDYDVYNYRNGLLYAQTTVVLNSWYDDETTNSYFYLISGTMKRVTTSASYSSSWSYFSSDSMDYVDTFHYPRTYTNHINEPTIFNEWQYTENDANYAYYPVVFETSPSLDPTAITLSNTKPNAGSAVNAVITPVSTSLSYGTLTYTYQYSIDNGTTWTNISTTTATSVSFIVPVSASQIKVRVRASDGIGFTSSNYVTSTNYTVNKFTNYAGVSGTVKGVSPKVCVGGSIKTNVTVKKGVNGTVK